MSEIKFRKSNRIAILEEQKRIAAILDKADRVRRKRQEAIRLTEELGRSIFIDMFGDPVTNPKGWKIVKIETIAAKEKNSMAIGPFGSNLKVSDYHESGYPIIFVKDVKENNFKWLSNRYVNDKKFKELSSHQVKPLDVLATKMGTPPLNLIKQKNKNQLLQLENLFNSLLQRAFRGEL